MGFYHNILHGVLPPTQLITPAVYDESLSYEEQIAHIFAILKRLEKKLEGYVTIEAFDAYAEIIKLEQAAQKIEWEKYTDDIADSIMLKLTGEVERLEKLIHDVIAGSVISYDPTHGQSYRSIDLVITRVYDFDRVFALPAKDYDDLNITCTRWNDLGVTAREYDVAGVLHLDKEREHND